MAENNEHDKIHEEKQESHDTHEDLDPFVYLIILLIILHHVRQDDRQHQDAQDHHVYCLVKYHFSNLRRYLLKGNAFEFQLRPFEVEKHHVY